ncbi:hypothetical protein C8T65DRAFT_660927, partial [Cerioporus squamosus]
HTFTGFVETNVDNPDCAKYPSNTYIQDIWFDNISGTSLSCSPDGRCSNINVNEVTVTPPSKYGPASFECQNVELSGDDASLFGTTTLQVTDMKLSTN